jgi:Uma2 family endonuclease
MKEAAHKRRRITIEEFERMGEEDAYRLSLVRGLVVREPRPGGRHAYVLGRVFWALEEYVRATGVGLVYLDVGVVIRPDPATVRGPDVAFYARGRVADPWPDGFFRAVPDLAVEILSPSNRRKEVIEKVADYLGSGGRMVWVVNPRRRTVEVHRLGQPAIKLQESDTLEGFDVMPGLRLSVAAFFALPPGYTLH